MKYGYFFLALASLALSACATGSSEQRLVATADSFCEEPRPEVCTLEYRPVCAQLRDGSRKTYSNGCSACADTNVESWIADACPE